MADGSFFTVVSEALRDFRIHGYDSADRLERWLDALRRAALRRMAFGQDPDIVEGAIRRAFDRAVEHRGALRAHPGVGRFTLDRVRLDLRAELDRRLAASANLIKLNRQQAIDKTLQRFSGWATSIPPGGSADPGIAEEGRIVRKALAQLPFEERRVAIDQGHKLVASVNRIIAEGGGAIAGIWRSKRQAGYKNRPDHLERDGKVYLMRDSWAVERGYVKPGPAGWMDSITQPAEEPFCSCSYVFVYSLRDFPDEMLTEKGRAALADVRGKMAAA